VRNGKVITCCSPTRRFTSPRELDPEDVGASLPYYARLRHELERHGGTVEKFIGDAVVALFAHPVAHEDDPERAVRAAIASARPIVELNEADHARARSGGSPSTRRGARGARRQASLGEGMASGTSSTRRRGFRPLAPVDDPPERPTYRANEQGDRVPDAPPVEAKGKANPVPPGRRLPRSARFGFDVEHAPARQSSAARGELDS